MKDNTLTGIKIVCSISFIVFVLFIFIIINQTDYSKNNTIGMILSLIIFGMTMPVVSYHRYKKNEEKRNQLHTDNNQKIASLF